jgi:superfamily II DNA/RNA helicase
LYKKEAAQLHHTLEQKGFNVTCNNTTTNNNILLYMFIINGDFNYNILLCMYMYVAIHGDKGQDARTAALEEFKSGR